jgi:hypothetical protein
MRIVIPGGSGHVGTLLARAFHARGDEVTVLSRNPRQAPWNVRAWDAATPGHWMSYIDGADAVVNLAGRSIHCRYTEPHRREIIESRAAAARVVGQSIREATRPPRVWLQASTASIYAHRFDAPNDEATGVLGGSERGAPRRWRFSVDAARAWEMALTAASTPATRKVALRLATVLGPDPGGDFDRLLWRVRWGLGGRAGSGRQFVSWIHDDDLVRAVDWLIEQDRISGAVNLAAPGALPNAQFMRELRRAWGARIGPPLPAWGLRLAAPLVGSEPELVLKSRRVAPGVLQSGGFEFHYPDWPDAARDLCRRWRLLRGEMRPPG